MNVLYVCICCIISYNIKTHIYSKTGQFLKKLCNCVLYTLNHNIKDSKLHNNPFCEHYIISPENGKIHVLIYFPNFVSKGSCECLLRNVSEVTFNNGN